MNAKILALTVATLVHALLSGEARYANINYKVSMTIDEDAPQQLSRNTVRLCVAETHISMAEMEKLRRNDFAGEQSMEMQCFVHCLYERMGWLRDGTYVPLEFIGLLADAVEANQLAGGGRAPWGSHCHVWQLRAENKCERAFAFHRCLLDVGDGAMQTPPPSTVPLMDEAVDLEH